MHEALQQLIYNAYFEIDMLRGSRVMTKTRRRHIAALSRALKNRPEGSIKPIPVLDHVNPDRIYRDYVQKKKPVIIKGAASDWPATQNWSFDFFKERFPDAELYIADEKFTRNRQGVGYEIDLIPYVMSDFVDDVISGKTVYLKFLPLLKKHPELLDDLGMEEMSNWSNGSLKHCDVGNEFYMGSDRTVTHLHSERCDIFHATIEGRKRWRLYPPSESLFLYPVPAQTLFIGSEVDFLNPDYDIHPWFRYANGYEAVLEKGDVLYFPTYYWHAVENLSSTISVNYIWYDWRRSATTLPIHWLNGISLGMFRKGGTIEQFIAYYKNRLLVNLHHG